jgi:hypothetical protein
MLSNLKTYFLTIRIRNALKNHHPERKMIPYHRAKNIGVLFNSQYEGKQAQFINQFFRRLRDDGKNVKSLTCLMHERSNPFDFKFDFFSEKDLSLAGELKSDVVDRFINADFDYLFCLNETPFLPFDFVLAQSKARFRIGLYQEEKPGFFELMVSPVKGQELDSVLSEMLDYTRRISEEGDGNKAG